MGLRNSISLKLFQVFLAIPEGLWPPGFSDRTMCWDYNRMPRGKVMEGGEADDSAQ